MRKRDVFALILFVAMIAWFISHGISGIACSAAADEQYVEWQYTGHGVCMHRDDNDWYEVFDYD